MKTFQGDLDQLHTKMTECQEDISCVKDIVQAWSGEDDARQDDWWN